MRLKCTCKKAYDEAVSLTMLVLRLNRWFGLAAALVSQKWCAAS